jgi:hypothetical protein
MHTNLTAALAHQHTRDLRVEGCRGRLATLAACCSPTRLRLAGTAISARLRQRDAACCTA